MSFLFIDTHATVLDLLLRHISRVSRVELVSLSSKTTMLRGDILYLLLDVLGDLVDRVTMEDRIFILLINV